MARTLSPEHRAAISAGMKQYAMTDAHRAAISAGLRSSEAFARAGVIEACLKPEYRAALRQRMRGNRNWFGNPKGECAYCGGVATQMDHVAPRAHGRREACPPEGCERVPVCVPCNSSKGARTPEEWLAAGLRGS